MVNSTSLDFMGKYWPGFGITLGLLITGGAWTALTFLKEKPTDQDKKEAKVWFGVLIVFLVLFFVKVFLADNIGDMAKKSVAVRVAGAAQQLKNSQFSYKKLIQLQNSRVAATEMSKRIFFGTTPMEITYALSTAVGVGLLYTKRKKEDQTDGDKTAAFFLILLLIFMFGSAIAKDSVENAVKNAEKAVAAATTAPAPSKA